MRDDDLSRREKLKAWLSQARYLAEEYYSAPYRGAIARAKRDEDDLFMLMVFSELMGVPNPVAYYTIELQPLMLERFQRLAFAHGHGAFAAG